MKKEINRKSMEVIDSNELDLTMDEYDYLAEFYEATNDSYHRFYPFDDDPYMEIELHKKISDMLFKNRKKSKQFSEYNSMYSILLHFDW